MHVALLFPPATDPRSPHLALPSLAATLRAAGVRTTLRDLDLEGLFYLLDPERVAASVRTCEGRLARSADPRQQERLHQALADADYVCANVGSAPDRLRNPETFYNPHEFYTARECIDRALMITSAAAGPVQYNIGPVQYDVAGCDAARLVDLADATADPRLNLFHDLWQERLLPDLERDRPDVVGISILNFQQILPGLMLARMLKQEGHFVVLGGTVYSKFVPQLLARPEFFHLFCAGVVVYEGETALLALLDQLAGGRDFRAVPNFVHLNAAGRPVLENTYAEDVNLLPTPDFDGLPLHEYLAPTPVLPILTGKGCYFNRCKFCDIPFINKVAGKAYRVRAPERVAADVALLKRRYGARHFEITDEALAPRLLLRLADAFADYPDLDARFVGYARLEPGFTPEVCERIHVMGLRKLFFGLESGSQRVLDHMDKGIQKTTAPAVLRNCADAGIGFHLFSIVGFPEETEDMARETLQFFLDNAGLIDRPRNSFDLHPFTLDLRTDYADHATRFGAEIDTIDLDRRDFPISVNLWRNTRGLDDDRIAQLLAEFTVTLRAAMPDYRQYPALLWPGFEEHALLYGDYYEDRPFSFRFSLPAEDDPLPFRLLWADSVQMREEGDGFVVRCITGETAAHRMTVMLLAQPPEPLPVSALLDALIGRLNAPPAYGQALRARLRAGVDALLRSGALRLEPAEGKVPLPR